MHHLRTLFTIAGILYLSYTPVVGAENERNQPNQIKQTDSSKPAGDIGPKSLLGDQVNPTDSLATPLDSDEIELNKESQTLENEEKEFSEDYKK